MRAPRRRAPAPSGELVLERAQLQEQVLGLAHGGLRARHGRDRVFQLERRVGRAADFARIAVLIRRAAIRARAFDVAIRQEHLPLLVVRLLDCLARDETAGREPPVKLRRELLVLGRVRRQVVVDADAVGREVAPVLGGHALDEHLGRGRLPARRAASSACRARRWRRRRGSGAHAAAGNAPRRRSGRTRPRDPGAKSCSRTAGRS